MTYGHDKYENNDDEDRNYHIWDNSGSHEDGDDQEDEDSEESFMYNDNNYFSNYDDDGNCHNDENNDNLCHDEEDGEETICYASNERFESGPYLT